MQPCTSDACETGGERRLGHRALLVVALYLLVDATLTFALVRWIGVRMALEVHVASTAVAGVGLVVRARRTIRDWPAIASRMSGPHPVLLRLIASESSMAVGLAVHIALLHLAVLLVPLVVTHAVAVAMALLPPKRGARAPLDGTSACVAQPSDTADACSAPSPAFSGASWDEIGAMMDRGEFCSANSSELELAKFLPFTIRVPVPWTGWHVLFGRETLRSRRRAVRRRPEDTEARIDLAASLLSEEPLTAALAEEAREHLEYSLRLMGPEPADQWCDASDHAMVHLFLGDALIELGRLGDARHHWQLAVELDPAGPRFGSAADAARQLQAHPDLGQDRNTTLALDPIPPGSGAP